MAHNPALFQFDPPRQQPPENSARQNRNTISVNRSSVKCKKENDIEKIGSDDVNNKASIASNVILVPSTIQHLQKDATLFFEGDKALYYYEVIFGLVKTYTMLDDGRCLITRFHHPGDFIGIPFNEHYSTTAQALERTNLRRYSYRDLNRIIDSSPEFVKKILRITRNEYLHAEKHMVLLARKSPEEKLATFLSTYKSNPTRIEGYQAVLYLPMSLTDIADHLGLAQETVCRALSKFKRNGMVATSKQRNSCELYLKDINALHKIAGF